MFLLALLLQAGSVMPLPASCPVTVQSVNVHLGLRPYDQVQIYARFHNEADKEIKATKFQFTYLDATHDEHPAYATYTSDRTVSPRKDMVQTWHDPLLTRGMFEGGAKVQVLKVLYKDGSVWEATSEDACTQKFAK